MSFAEIIRQSYALQQCKRYTEALVGYDAVVDGDGFDECDFREVSFFRFRSFSGFLTIQIRGILFCLTVLCAVLVLETM
jgi:hypothetical protein